MRTTIVCLVLAVAVQAEAAHFRWQRQRGVSWYEESQIGKWTVIRDTRRRCFVEVHHSLGVYRTHLFFLQKFTREKLEAHLDAKVAEHRAYLLEQATTTPREKELKRKLSRAKTSARRDKLRLLERRRKARLAADEDR